MIGRKKLLFKETNPLSDFPVSKDESFVSVRKKQFYHLYA